MSGSVASAAGQAYQSRSRLVLVVDMGDAITVLLPKSKRGNGNLAALASIKLCTIFYCFSCYASVLQ